MWRHGLRRLLSGELLTRERSAPGNAVPRSLAALKKGPAGQLRGPRLSAVPVSAVHSTPYFRNLEQSDKTRVDLPVDSTVRSEDERVVAPILARHWTFDPAIDA